MSSPVLLPLPLHLSAYDKEGNGKGNKSNGNSNKEGSGDGGKSDGNSNKDGKGKGSKRDGDGNKEGVKGNGDSN
jgi:hypothetical protein